MRKLLMIIGIFVAFSGCGLPDGEKINNTENTLQKFSFSEIELSVSEDLKIRPSADQDHRILDNDFNNNDLDQPHEYRIEFFSTSMNCSPSLTGASQMQALSNANGQVQWGKVDLSDLMGQEGYMPSYDTDNVKCGTTANAYALCAERDGRTVVICINQVADNPAFAEETFETFRWLQ